MSQKKNWSSLSPTTKGAVVAAIVLHIGLIGVAHADLTHRPAEQIRGPKWLWRLLAVANSSFSVLYLTWGRHRAND